jgi:hypothetical protein
LVLIFTKVVESCFCCPSNVVVKHHRRSIVKAHTVSSGETAVLSSPLRVGVMGVV